MTIVRTQINCPNCRQPITADIQQLFNVGADPTAKNRLLTGQFNLAQCPHCGYSGNLSTPMVYHDPSKELLLTYFPPELNQPRDEQERALGKIISQLVDNMPQEQRKGYLLNPQAVLTLQGLVERVLQEDGITKEMIEAQQERASLIQSLATIADQDTLAKTAKEEDEKLDAEFFGLLSQLIQVSAAQGDEAGARGLADLHNKLLPLTTFGKEILARQEEVNTALEELKEIGEDLTREKLLELVVNAPNADRVEAYASLVRPGMDYEFFQQLSEKIEAAEGDEKQRLTDLREQLLEITRQIDEQIQARMEVANKNLETLLEVDDIAGATRQNLGAIDDFFLQALAQAMETAKEAEDTEKLKKLEEIIIVIQEASKASAGPDPELMQQLVEAEDSTARKKIMEANADQINQQFVEALTALLMQFDSDENEEARQFAEKVREAYRDAVRFSMEASMKAEEEKKEE